MKEIIRFIGALSSAVFLGLLVSCQAGGEAVQDATVEEAVETPENAKTIVLGAGCFWCVEEIFEPQKGVLNVVSGYAGGPEENPTYSQVSAGQTGHTEVVKITYDPAVISLERLLTIFWLSFDASNGRGVAPDFGSQYRPIVFYSDDAEKAVILASKEAEEKRISKPVATEIVGTQTFWPAEKYHQDYVEKNPWNGYVRQVSKPRYKRTMKDLEAFDKAASTSE